METETKPEKFIDIVFDGPPSHESGRFVEVENEQRRSIRFGEWVERDDGYWCLRFPDPAAAHDELIAALEASVQLQSHYASLLNQYDGGNRKGFADAEEWLKRLAVTSKAKA